MKAFSYLRSNDALHAASAVAATSNSKFIAGGTNLLDLMKLGIETPRHLVDISRLPLNKVEQLARRRLAYRRHRHQQRAGR
jgi:xanthine dehydrogenase YagS FAD-binding subunit